ncbi:MULTISPECIES: zinc ribbon domain-containing protein [Moorena]|nr:MULTISPECIES: zinc ribbon domain-containing protein [Moorena]NEP64552.1 IS200/IS605 family element transposase accessory protein TnpB [Moorena sp. SIO3A5]NEQ05730.1 IS200/IS605 family element transposase accessory protein TnpB [Moorena sp. SIO4E2]NER87280.1 IS200/IS605 family element transposase accessory protein TnpB [Moorena sp. SIO3A2]NES41900.1 IS200/IS605 family element transposase accessory protein TnpB [Moorena sp. SIO2C4]OLT64754.1 transposase [Moorena producens 3L]
MPKQSTTNKKISTQIVPVVGMTKSVENELLATMKNLGIVRSESDHKLGSINHWGIDWKKSYPEVRTFRTPDSLGLPSKLMEWTVSDVAKAITAQQAASIDAVVKKVYKRFPGKANLKVRKDQCLQLKTLAFMDSPLLHRLVRKEYQRGHSWIRNKIVYQQGGYKCKRVSRNTYQLELAGLKRGKRNKVLVRSNRKIKGQIRLIHNQLLQRFEVHFLVDHGRVDVPLERPSIGIDKGYTEAFFDSEGKAHGKGLGRLASKKSDRICAKNRNRGKLWALHRKLEEIDPAKSARILENNLGRKTENRRYRKDLGEILAVIGQASKSLLGGKALKVFAEDLTQPITNKRQSKAMSRKLNSWMIGLMRDSLQKWANWTGSVVTEVQPSYTSQIDSRNGTLLGKRTGDNFTGFDGVVLQADHNAAKNILARGTDFEISRFSSRAEVQAVLLRRTARYLKGLGLSLANAVELGWLDSKHTKTQTFKQLLAGMSGTSK